MTQEQITRLRALCDADRLPPEQPVIGLRAVFDWAEHLRTELARLWEGTDATPVKPGEVVTVLRECEVLAAEVERLRREVDQCRTELGAVAYHAEHDPCDVCTHLEISDVIAERDNLAAKVARVKALADQWRRTAAEPAALRALIEWALADREARTHDLRDETLIPTWVIRDRADALKETP